MKTICQTCGKKGHKKGKPVIENGKEIASHVTCDDFCVWGMVEISFSRDSLKQKLDMFFYIVGETLEDINRQEKLFF